MSALERRLQVLLDEPRFARVAQEAQRSGRSVGAVIREAIDLRFPDTEEDVRVGAAAALLTLTEEPGEEPGEGPAALKEAYARELADKAGPT